RGFATSCGDYGYLSVHQLGCHLGKSLGLALGPAVFNGHILTLDEAGLLQALAERAQALCVHVGVIDAHKSNYWNCGLLRPRRERPRGRAAEERDELAPFHSITSSASASNLSGISRPSALAVLRLITSSNFVGSITGRSPGFSPLRMRPA